MKISLRVLLFLALIFLTALPVVMLGVWEQKTTLEREYAKVYDQHLLIAKNLTFALDRYAKDIKSVFKLLSSYPVGQEVPFNVASLAQSLQFAYFQLENQDGEIQNSKLFMYEDSGSIPPEITRAAWSSSNEREILVHPVALDGTGVPKIYLSRIINNTHLATAKVCLDYIQELQKLIVFGNSGHSAIVDQAGNLLAHPKKSWVAHHKNLSQLEPVKQMMSGHSGVLEFFSPAKNQDMITGYSTVPEVGWGVMIPQALSELHESAYEIIRKLWSVLILGILLTAAFAWWLSGWIIAPLKRITSTANRMNKGDLSARVLPYVNVPAHEFSELGLAFDKMAQSLQNNNAHLRIKLEKRELEKLQHGNNKKTKGKILVVDDSPLNVLEITGWLSKAGYSTFSALTNEESMKIASVIQPDMAIVGVLSNSEGGFQHRVKLVSLLEGVGTAVISVFPTGLTGSKINEIGLDSVATLSYPLDENQLVEMVEGIIQASNWKNLDVKLI